MKTTLGVVIDRAAFNDIEDAIREHHITYHSESVAEAGFQNLIVWGGPHEDSAIVLIAGES